MNREQAALYTNIEALFPGALKTLLPDIPEKNYPLIRSFGEGKPVRYKTTVYHSKEAEEKTHISFTGDFECYRIEVQDEQNNRPIHCNR